MHDNYKHQNGLRKPPSGLVSPARHGVSGVERAVFDCEVQQQQCILTPVRHVRSDPPTPRFIDS